MSTSDRQHPDGANRSERPASATFEALYTEAAPALYAWAELRIRPALRARLDPQDLVQEVWLRGMRSFERFDEGATSFRAWSFKIGKNVLLEAIRSTHRESSGPGGSSATQRMLALEGIPQNVTSFTQRLAREDSVREFLAHAGSLDEPDRMLLVHCGLEDETCAEAAVKLGMNEDAAIKRWQRLKAKLREKPWARALLGLEAGSGLDASGSAQSS